MFAFLVNAGGILAGTLAGMLLHSHLSKRFIESVRNALGLVTAILAVSMAVKADFLPVAASVLLGTAIGELAGVDRFVGGIASFLKKRAKSGDQAFSEGFITATMLFCIGPMAIVGSILDGISGDASVIYAKTVLDGFASVVLSSTLGIGVAFSALSIVAYQGAMTFAAASLAPYLTQTAINLVSATGGVLIVGISLDLLNVKKVNLANMLPSLLVAFLISMV